MQDPKYMLKVQKETTGFLLKFCHICVSDLEKEETYTCTVAFSEEKKIISTVIFRIFAF